MTIEPYGYDTQIAANQIVPYTPLTWNSDTYPGTSNYYRHCWGAAYPFGAKADGRLGMKASFRPGIITAQTFGDQDITFLAYDAYL